LEVAEPLADAALGVHASQPIEAVVDAIKLGVDAVESRAQATVKDRIY